MTAQTILKVAKADLTQISESAKMINYNYFAIIYNKL